MVDVSNNIDPDDMPLCPYCDNAIEKSEPAVIVKSGPFKGLAHAACLEASEED